MLKLFYSVGGVSFSLRVQRLLLLLAVLVPLLAFESVLKAESPVAGEKHLLIHYSCSANFAPDFQIQQAFNRAIVNSGLQLRVRHVELNACFPETGEAAAGLHAILLEITAGKFDTILAMGRSAVDLLKENIGEIPAKVPRVFSGLDADGAELQNASVLLRPADRKFFYGVCVLILLLVILIFISCVCIVTLLRRNRKMGAELAAARLAADYNFKLLQAVFDITPTGFSIKDADNNYRFVMCNRAFAAMVERPVHEIIGHDDFELKFTTFDAFTCVSQDKKVIQTGIPCDVIEQTHPGFTDNKAFRVMKMPLYLDGRGKMVIGLFMDISKYIVLEQQQNSLMEEQSKSLDNSEIICDCLRYAVIEPDFSKAVSDMLAKIGRKMEADHCDIFTFVNDYKELECRYSWQFDDEQVRFSGPRRYPLTGLGEWLKKIKNNETIIVDDCESLAEKLPAGVEMARKFNVKSIMFSGIWEDGQLIGIVKVDFVRTKHHFSVSALKMLQEAVQIYSLAKIRYRQMTEIQERAENARLTNVCLESILIEENIEKTVEKILSTVCSRTGGSRALLIRYDVKKHCCHCNVEYVANGGEKTFFGTGDIPFKEDAGWYKKLKSISTPMMFNPNDADFHVNWPILQGIIERNAIYRVYAGGLREKGVLIGSLCIIFEGKTLVQASDQTTVFVTAAVHLLELLAERIAIHQNMQHALEQALAANKAKSYFIGSISHEIRTPLNSVLGFSELLQTGTYTEEEQREYLRNIKSSGTALLRLIDDLLDISAIETGSMIFHPESTDFPALCHEVAEPFRKAAQAKNLTFLCENRPMPLLMLDQKRIRQILWNLLDNAVKFTEHGSISLSSDFTPSEDGIHGTLSFHVKDTGIGISAADMENLYQPFVQLSRMRGTAADNSGTGLGLAVIRRIIKRMNGKTILDSSPGSGSDFAAILREVVLVKDIPPAVKNTPLPMTGNSVLVVDDVSLNLKVIAAMLKKLGFVPVCASSGVEALEILRSISVDLVMTDLWMPGMNGAELTDAIRNELTDRTLHIVAVTADTDVAANFPMEKFDGILYKPVTQDKLRNVLATVISRKAEK